MNIVEVVPYFYPAWAYGGPAKLVYDVSMFFSNTGHQIQVITSDCYDATSRMPLKKRIQKTKSLQVHYFANVSNYIAYRFNLHFAPWLFVGSMPIVFRSDIVHIHDFYTVHNIWIVLLCFLFRKPYIFSVHGCLEEVRKREKSTFKEIFLSIFGYTMLRQASFVIATSESERESYLAAGVLDTRIVQFGHGINPDEFVSTLTKVEARRKYAIPLDATVFTYLGRLHKIKGLDLLLEAFAKLKDVHAFLVIAGSDDGYGDMISELIRSHGLEKKVLQLGPVFGSEKADLFRASTVFVYPSRSEGFSLGILEAASAGLPLLLTKGCHFEEAGEVGAALIVPTTADSLRQGLKKMIDAGESVKKMGSRARKLIETTYSLEIIGQKYQDVYTKAISGYGKN